MNAKYKAMLVGLAALALLVIPLSAQAQNMLVTLTITRVRQIDNVDYTRAGEFYARVKMRRMDLPRTRHRDNDGDVSPDWTFRQGARAGSRVPIWIHIYDYDDPGRDNHCDVSPIGGRKGLEIFYDLSTGRIGGDVAGREGDLIHARGAGDSNRVEIWFRLTQSP